VVTEFVTKNSLPIVIKAMDNILAESDVESDKLQYKSNIDLGVDVELLSTITRTQQENKCIA
jgi:hypothetical protein